MNANAIYLAVRGTFVDGISANVKRAMSTVATSCSKAGRIVAGVSSAFSAFGSAAGSALGKVGGAVGNVVGALAAMGPIGGIIAGISAAMEWFTNKTMQAAKAAEEFAKVNLAKGLEKLNQARANAIEGINRNLAELSTRADKAAKSFDTLAAAYLKVAGAKNATEKAGGDAALADLRLQKQNALSGAANPEEAALKGAGFDVQIAKRRLDNVSAEAEAAVKTAAQEAADANKRAAAAETAVNRDNLAANIRQGLVRPDAAQLVAQLSDAQVNALCPNGNPPRFAPVKRVRGGTRNHPKYEPERRRTGSRGGSVRISRDTSAQHLAEVCRLPASPTEQLADLARKVDSSGRSNGATVALAPVSAETAAEIAHLSGRAPKNLSPSVGADEIRHTFIRHGKPTHGKTTGERQKNQLPVTAEDIAKLPEIISAYDRISGGSTEKRRRLPTVRFVKAYRDGTAYSVFVVADTMEFKTMWKRKVMKA